MRFVECVGVIAYGFMHEVFVEVLKDCLLNYRMDFLQQVASIFRIFVGQKLIFGTFVKFYKFARFWKQILR